jgi:hypothetical protein
MSIYGQHDIPIDIHKNGVTLHAKSEKESTRYVRELIDERIEKIILTKNQTILINPIEPLHMPREMTPYLLIKTENPVVIEPKTTRKIYLKFPVEIGVFIHGGGEYKVLDILSLAKQKLTLYGEIRGGIICKFWESQVFDSIPQVDPLNEGVMEFTIVNHTTRWHEITTPVFNAYGMKLYYGENMVSMRAGMKIYTGGIGETEFYDSPIYKGMAKSIELYTARMIPVKSPKFVMEWGL